MNLIHPTHDTELVEEEHFGRTYDVEECSMCGTRDIVKLYGPCPEAQLVIAGRNAA